MAESAAASNAALLNLLAGLPKTLFGSSTSRTTTGGNVTEQTMFSKEAVDSLLRGIMEGTSGGVGLAQVASGQKAPGLYNSTARNMLINDYSTRAAGVVAEKTAPKVTTRAPTVTTEKIPGLMSSGTGLMLGAAALLGTKGGRKKIEDAYDFLSKEFGFGGDVSSAIGQIDNFDPAIAAMRFADVSGSGFSPLDFGGAVSEYASAGIDFSGAADLASSGASIFESSAALEEAMLLDSFNPEYADMGLDLGFSTAGLGQALQGDFAQAGVQAGMAAIPVVGPFLAAGDALLGGQISEGPGGLIDEAFGFVEDIFGGLGGKVICTELCRQGLMSKHLYIAEASANLKRLSATTLRGYHAIAVPVVHKMRKSSALSKFLQPWVLDYSNEILGYGGGLRGKFVRYILEPVCFVVGLVVSEQDYKSLYKAA